MPAQAQNIEKMSATTTVLFSKSATIADVETKVDELFSSPDVFSKNIESLELDFSSSEYIEVVSLIFVIALVAKRAKKGLHTRIRLPRQKKARDFLRVWQFPDAIRRATRIPFFDLVCKDDLKYFGENINEDQIQYSTTSFDHGVGRLLSDRFFAIKTLAVEPMFSGVQLVVDESNRWENQLVKSVLSKHLTGPEGYLASRVVFESMTNAIRHSGARVIQTASRFAASGEDGNYSAGQFTLVYWDDGNSLIDTLKTAIHAGKKVRNEASLPPRFNYRLSQEFAGQKNVEQLIPSSFTPNNDTLDALLLFSTVLPGITRDVEGKGRLVHQQFKGDQPDYDGPGMGLFVLINTIVDVFGGSLAIRSGGYFMNIKKASQKDKEAKYKVKIKTYSETSPCFLGNMLTIRLPISENK